MVVKGGDSQQVPLSAMPECALALAEAKKSGRHPVNLAPTNEVSSSRKVIGLLVLFALGAASLAAMVSSGLEEPEVARVDSTVADPVRPYVLARPRRDASV